MSVRKQNPELLVGFFVILGFVIVSLIVFAVSGVYFFRPGYKMAVVFDNINGIWVGSPVRFAGVQSGEVQDVDVFYDERTGKPQARLTLFLKKGIEIRERTQIYLRGSTPLSEAYLDVTSRGEEDGRVLQPGDTIYGIEPVPIEMLVSTGQEIATQLKQTIMHMNTFLADEEGRRALRETILHLSRITRTLDRALSGREANIRHAIENLEVSTNHLKTIMQRVEAGEGTTGKLVSSEELYQEVLEFVRDLKRHPWKLLKKGKEDDEDKKKEEEKKAQAAPTAEKKKGWF